MRVGPDGAQTLADSGADERPATWQPRTAAAQETRHERRDERATATTRDTHAIVLSRTVSWTAAAARLASLEVARGVRYCFERFGRCQAP